MQSMQRIPLLAAALVALTLLASPSLAAKPEVNTRGPGGLLSEGERWDHALNGYDTVAYFTEGRPVPGKDAFVSTYKGATFRFASAENQALFQADPARYAPQYGGYCAYAVSQGVTASGDPAQWEIHEGRLYLNLNADIQKRWQADKARYIADADRHWPAVLE